MYKLKKYINTINGDSMKVKDIMTKNLITCEIDDSIHQIAQKMKAKGQSSDFIADITGLTIEEIEEL